MTALCTRLHRARRPWRRCSSLRTRVRCFVSPCPARRSRHTRAHPTAVSRFKRAAATRQADGREDASACARTKLTSRGWRGNDYRGVARFSALTFSTRVASGACRSGAARRSCRPGSTCRTCRTCRTGRTCWTSWSRYGRRNSHHGGRDNCRPVASTQGQCQKSGCEKN